MKKMFALTAGDYSDYHIVGLFSSKEALFKEAGTDDEKVINNSGMRIEEYELDKPLSLNKITTSILMEKDGSVTQARTYIPNDWDTAKDFGFQTGQPLRTCWYFHIETEYQDRAIKVANERRTQLIALDLWEYRKMD